MNDLKQQLRDLRTQRLINFGNSGYQRVSQDWHFNNVPKELWKFWYSNHDVSFVTLSIAYDSSIDSMSDDELKELISKEEYILKEIKQIFSKLLMKEGTKNGKN